MNILILSWKDIQHPQKWGAEVVLWNYALELQKIWHSVIWLSSKHENAQESNTIDGIKVLRVWTINTMYFKIWNYYKKNLRGQFDLIIDQAGGPPLFSPLYAQKVAKVFFIHHISDLEWDYKFIFPLNKIFKYIYNKTICLYKNETTIAVSNSTKHELVQKFWFQSEKVYSIENALDIRDVEEPKMDEKENSILFFWRLTPLKRVEHAILAFSIFLKEKPDYVLNIVWPASDKKYYKQLQDLVHSLELQKKIHFVWSIALENRSSIKNNKILLVPSHKEWFWLVVLEANVYGIPALWYKVWGIRDSIKDGINGYKHEDGDYNAMATTLLRIISDQREFETLAMKSFQHVQSRNSFSKNTKELEKILIAQKNNS